MKLLPLRVPRRYFPFRATPARARPLMNALAIFNGLARGDWAFLFIPKLLW